MTIFWLPCRFLDMPSCWRALLTAAIQRDRVFARCRDIDVAGELASLASIARAYCLHSLSLDQPQFQLTNQVAARCWRSFSQRSISSRAAVAVAAVEGRADASTTSALLAT